MGQERGQDQVRARGPHPVDHVPFTGREQHTDLVSRLPQRAPDALAESVEGGDEQQNPHRVVLLAWWGGIEPERPG